MYTRNLRSIATKSPKDRKRCTLFYSTFTQFCTKFANFFRFFTKTSVNRLIEHNKWNRIIVRFFKPKKNIP